MLSLTKIVLTTSGVAIPRRAYFVQMIVVNHRDDPLCAAGGALDPSGREWEIASCLDGVPVSGYVPVTGVEGCASRRFPVVSARRTITLTALWQQTSSWNINIKSFSLGASDVRPERTCNLLSGQLLNPNCFCENRKRYSGPVELFENVPLGRNFSSKLHELTATMLASSSSHAQLEEDDIVVVMAPSLGRSCVVQASPELRFIPIIIVYKVLASSMCGFITKPTNSTNWWSVMKQHYSINTSRKHHHVNEELFENENIETMQISLVLQNPKWRLLSELINEIVKHGVYEALQFMCGVLGFSALNQKLLTCYPAPSSLLSLCYLRRCCFLFLFRNISSLHTLRLRRCDALELSCDSLKHVVNISFKPTVDKQDLKIIVYVVRVK